MIPQAKNRKTLTLRAAAQISTHPKGTTMKTSARRPAHATATLAALLASAWMAAPAGAATINVACPGQTIQNALASAQPGDTIMVSGTCAENVLVRNEKLRFTIDGGNVAVINAPGNTSAALTIRGKGIVVQNFANITGGSRGIEVQRGSSAVINNNTIQATGGDGVYIHELAFAALTFNLIQNNPRNGVQVSYGGTANIGFNFVDDAAASANIIDGNTLRGVNVSEGAMAWIAGNTIANNGSDGIGVLRNGRASVASNAINGNGGNGVNVSENASVDLGEDSPVTFFQQPNTTTINNSGYGIQCTLGAVVKGHLGSSNKLNGTLAQFGNGTGNTFGSGCLTATSDLVTP